MAFGFALLRVVIGPKPSQLIRRQTKTNRDLVARGLTRFR